MSETDIKRLRVIKRACLAWLAVIVLLSALGIVTEGSGWRSLAVLIAAAGLVILTIMIKSVISSNE